VEWTRRGLVFAPDAQAPWIGTHAALPASVDLDDRHRVFLSSRDRQGRSHIGYVDFAPDFRRVIEIGPNEVVGPGPLGSFDDAGVTSSCVVRHDRRLYLYYTGWSLGVSVPFYLFVGLAVSEDEGRTFRKCSRAPLLERSECDPFLTASPWVLHDRGGWRMWYVSGTGWTSTGAKARHRYHIKYAESTDGVMWRREGTVCIDYASDEEYAFSRPCVIRDNDRENDRYMMWYAYRGDRYRIGYAESDDGIEWIRKDANGGLPPSSSGWDAEMVTYPCILRSERGYEMLYNGNGYGRTGVGLATAR
jgi:hypothetical protein